MAFSNAEAALKASEKPLAIAVATQAEAVIMAALQDVILLAPAVIQPILQGLDAELAPVIKAFLDAQIAKIGS